MLRVIYLRLFYTLSQPLSLYNFHNFSRLQDLVKKEKKKEENQILHPRIIPRRQKVPLKFIISPKNLLSFFYPLEISAYLNCVSILCVRVPLYNNDK